MPLQNSTPVATGSGHKPINEFIPGDAVLTAILQGGKPVPRQASVGFSQGTGDGTSETMVYVMCSDDRELIITMDGVLLIANGTLCRASRLIPGMYLMGADGQQLQVMLVSVGRFQDGVHDIATDLPWANNIDRHIIFANGIAIGDFMVESHFDQLSPGVIIEGYNELPEVGTKAYAQLYGGVQPPKGGDWV